MQIPACDTISLVKRLFNALVVVSLVLFIATGALWVSSYWKSLEVYRDKTAAGEVSLISNRGIVAYWRYWRPPSRHSSPAENRSVNHLIPMQIREQAIPGFTFKQVWLALDLAKPTEFTFRDRRAVVVAHWLLATVWSVLPVIWLVSSRRHRRARRRLRLNLCPACGYDLRATPGRCPECGTTCGLV